MAAVVCSWKGLRCSGGRLIYLSRRWQVQITDRSHWKLWRVPGFGAGFAVAKLDIVWFPSSLYSGTS
jgi:hypothetical protein